MELDQLRSRIDMMSSMMQQQHHSQMILQQIQNITAQQKPDRAIPQPWPLNLATLNQAHWPQQQIPAIPQPWPVNAATPYQTYRHKHQIPPQQTPQPWTVNAATTNQAHKYQHQIPPQPMPRPWLLNVTPPQTYIPHNLVPQHIVLERIKDTLPQNPLQFGFTSGASPTLAILAVSEAIANAHDRREALYLLTCDVRKAFDVVRQDSLTRKLFNHVDSHSWKFVIQNLATLAHVKLTGTLGDSFNALQGVGQGKILSTHCYKIYVDNLLDRLENSTYGYQIGGTYVGSPTCADDVILIASNPTDLQTQLNAVADYAKQEHYVIHPQKSYCVTYGVLRATLPQLNDTTLELSEKLTHLGVDRYTDSPSPSQVITDRNR